VPSSVRGGVLQLREQVMNGSARCPSGGAITLEFSGSDAEVKSMSFVGVWSGRSARATLLRVAETTSRSGTRPRRPQPVTLDSTKVTPADQHLAALLAAHAWLEAHAAVQAALNEPLPGLPSDHPSREFIAPAAMAILASFPHDLPDPSLDQRILLNNLGVGLALHGLLASASEVFTLASARSAPSAPVASGTVADRMRAADAWLTTETVLGPIRRNLSTLWRRAKPGARRGDAKAGTDLDGLGSGPGVQDEVALLQVAENGRALLSSVLETEEARSGLAEVYRQVVSWKGGFVRRFRLSAERIRMAATGDRATAIASLSALQRLQIEQGQQGQLALARLSDIAHVLKPDEVLADLYEIERESSGHLSRHYFCFLVKPDASVVPFELGSAEEIDAKLNEWTNELASPQSNSVAPLLTLSALAWSPIAAHLPRGATRIWLAPDGRLTLIPWQALQVVSKEAQPQVIAEVDSARALIERHPLAVAPTPPRALLVGDVDYGARTANRRPLLALPSSGAEIARVRTVVSAHGFDPVVLSGLAATKEAVRAALPVQILHFATHGLVRQLRETKPPVLSIGPWALLNPERDRTVRLPSAETFGRSSASSDLGRLSQAAVALAGANQSAPFEKPTPVYLTDLDLLGLNLSRTDLVVLSSCDTGKSETLGYQGLLNMQAAVTIAQARTVVMSLGKVNDVAGPALMGDFYDNLLTKKMPKARALREMQASAYAQKLPPASWAGWILFGDGW
jgi:CHAT domain-containing protein